MMERFKLNFKIPIFHILFFSIVGILIYSFSVMTQWYVILSIILLLIVSLIFLYDKKIAIFLILVMLFSFGTSFFYYSYGTNRSDIFRVRIDKKYEDYYIASSNNKKFYLYTDEVFETNKVIEFKGKFKEEINIEKGYVGHLFVKDIISVKSDFITKVRDISKVYFEFLNPKIGEKKAGLSVAMILGNKDYIDLEAKDDFKNVGILHLICISGFHIVFIYNIFKFVVKEKSGLILTFLYVVLTGITASGIRAFIMLFIAVFGIILKRNYNTKAAIAFSALILLFMNPAYIFDIGFLLSFLATIGIIFFNKVFNRIFYFLPNFLNTSISLSLSAQIFIVPIMILSFGSFSMNFILGSLILTPVIYIGLPIGLLDILLFLCNIDIGILKNILRAVLSLFNLIVNYLKFYALETYYYSNMFVIAYIGILLIFFMVHKKYIDFKYYKITYIIFGVYLLFEFNFVPKLYYYSKSYNSAIIIEDRFRKVAFTKSNSEYFLENLRQENSINEIVKIKKDISFEVGRGILVNIKADIDKSFIMLRDNNYGIIDLLNKNENLIIINDRIYINERGN